MQVERAIPDRGLPGGEIFSAYLKGQCTREEWLIHEAVRSADHADQHAVRVYPPMKDFLRNYCFQRAERTIPYDSTIARKLGDWFREINDAFQYNQERVELYEWALSKLAPVNLQNHMVLLERAIKRFSGMRLPAGDVEAALKTKEIDANERDRKHA